ncbi:DUF2599 domain-containing protein [Cellulomonas soli]|uniref:DUF2599 domain-containing protein n=1 Tax=Cellulomonas soli TaxID=931535 RepID=UPI003F84A455
MRRHEAGPGLIGEPAGRRARRAGAPRVALLTVALLSSLAACTATEAPPSPTVAAPSTSTATPAADVTLVSGDLTLTMQLHTGTAVGTTPGEDGSAQATLERVVPAAEDTAASKATEPQEDSPLVTLQPPQGTTATVLSDRSATFTDASGALVGALGAPTGPYGAALVARKDGAIDVVAPSDLDEPVGLWLASAALLDAQWGEQEGGRSLSVTPTAWTRAGSLAAQELTWAQLVAREPEADSPTMHDQLLCHMLGAPTKDTWNLEPWRPEVDLVTLVATKCNPTETDAG